MSSKSDCPECGVSPEDINKLTDEIDRLRQERDELHTLGQKASERADAAERDRDLWRERHDRERAAHAKNLEEQWRVEAQRNHFRSHVEEARKRTEYPEFCKHPGRCAGAGRCMAEFVCND